MANLRVANRAGERVALIHNYFGKRVNALVSRRGYIDIP